jgi:sarcosine oxidase gamma subunit
VKIVLVVTDSKEKNLVFAADTLKAYPLDESIKLTKQGSIENIHVVRTGPGSYFILSAGTHQSALLK